jgi:hypothetical protein
VNLTLIVKNFGSPCDLILKKLSLLFPNADVTFHKENGSELLKGYVLWFLVCVKCLLLMLKLNGSRYLPVLEHINLASPAVLPSHQPQNANNVPVSIS